MNPRIKIQATYPAKVIGTRLTVHLRTPLTFLNENLAIGTVPDAMSRTTLRP